MTLQHPAFIPPEDGLHGGQEGQLAKALVGSAVRPVYFEAAFVAVREPCGDLLARRLLQPARKGSLARAGFAPGNNLPAGIGDAGLLRARAKRIQEGDNATAAQE